MVNAQIEISETLALILQRKNISIDIFLEQRLRNLESFCREGCATLKENFTQPKGSCELKG